MSSPAIFLVPVKYRSELLVQRCLAHFLKTNIVKTLTKKLMEMETGYDDLFDQLVADTIQKQIEKTVEQFPVQCRDIFRKSRYEGMTHQKIAEDLNISIRTVETQIYRALKILKKTLSQMLMFLLVSMIVSFPRIFETLWLCG